MAEVAEATLASTAVSADTAQDEEVVAEAETAAGEEAQPEAPRDIVFYGTQCNMAMGVAMLVAGALAFSMGMTHVFFAEAIAWTFVLWGILLIYGDLLDIYEIYRVTEDALVIYNPLRPWGLKKIWDWGHIHRLDIVVRRPDARYEDAMLQVYYTPEGELTLEREDRVYDPELARLIIERAGLQPADSSNPTDLTRLPAGRTGTYTWKK